MTHVRLAGIALIIVALGALPAFAHHGWSGYDAGKTMTLDGVIKESGYEHPHGHIRLDVPGKTWTVTLAQPSRMEILGLETSMPATRNRTTVVGITNHSDQNDILVE